MSAAGIPLLQPGDTKVLRITLTQAEWTRLATACVNADMSLEQFVNEIVRDEIVRDGREYEEALKEIAMSDSTLPPAVALAGIARAALAASGGREA